MRNRVSWHCDECKRIRDESRRASPGGSRRQPGWVREPRRGSSRKNLRLLLTNRTSPLIPLGFLVPFFRSSSFFFDCSIPLPNLDHALGGGCQTSRVRGSFAPLTEHLAQSERLHELERKHVAHQDGGRLLRDDEKPEDQLVTIMASRVNPCLFASSSAAGPPPACRPRSISSLARSCDHRAE